MSETSAGPRRDFRTVWGWRRIGVRGTRLHAFRPGEIVAACGMSYGWIDRRDERPPTLPQCRQCRRVVEVAT